MIGPQFDNGVEGVKIIRESGGCGGCRDVTSINVDPVGDLVPD